MSSQTGGGESDWKERGVGCKEMGNEAQSRRV